MENRKVVCIFTNDNSPKLQEFKSLKKMYEKNNITIFEIMDFEGNVNILTLEETLRQNDIDLINIDIISDKMDLIVSAYRIYQNHFQNFIYLYNPNFNDITSHNPILIQDLLEDFCGIENENINSKIYLNLNDSNFNDLMEIMHHYCGYLSLLENYEVNKMNNEKIIVNKRYWINPYDNIFIDFDSKLTEDISLFSNNEDSNSKIIKISNVTDTKIAIYYLIYHLIKRNNIGYYIKIIDEIYRIFDEKKFFEFERFLIEFIDKKSFIPQTKILLYGYLIPYREEFHETLYRKSINFIYSGQLEWKYWKSLIFMFKGFSLNKKLVLSDDIYRIEKEVNIKISEVIEKQNEFKLEKKQEVNNKKVVILIDQLLSLKHSPTNVLKVQLDSLLKETDCEYHIVVEENLIIPINERIPGSIVYIGTPSKQCVQPFSEMFDNNRVKFYLIDETADIITRVNNIFQIVTKINPKLIFSLSSYSTAQNILYKYYPIINLSFGREYLIGKAHLYLYKNYKRAKELANKFNDNVKIKKYKTPPMNIPRTKSYTRSEFGFTDNDFIVITSGNRINSEIDNTLIDEMKIALKDYPNIKWLLVGATVPIYLKESYPKNIFDNQIVHISFEEDLIALNEICDISINPNRIGGGYSVTSCLIANTPVLMCNFESDGLVFLGVENTCGNSYKELINELIKCFQDKTYKDRILEKQKLRLIKRNEDFTRVLVKYFDEIQNNFSL